MTAQPFVLSAFTMSTVSHGNFGLWRHPDDRTSAYTDVRYWVDLAKLLDDGGFDVLFIADAVGQLDVFGGDASAALRLGVQTPVTDPNLIPELRRRGRTGDSGGTTLRERIFGKTALLPDEHPASAFRRKRILSI
jgi:hypothetical protein